MRLIFIVISLFFTSVCISQINIINRSLTDSSINIFYIGVDNAIELKGVKNEAEYVVSVTRAGSQMRHQGNKIYLVSVQEVADTCILVVYNKSGKKVFERNYKTRTIPPAVAALGGQRDTTIRISRILANPFLNIIFRGCYMRMNCRVISFIATFIYDADSIITMTTGHLLSDEQIRLIKTSRPGDIIKFNDIYAISPDSRKQRLLPFRIKIE